MDLFICILKIKRNFFSVSAKKTVVLKNIVFFAPSTLVVEKSQLKKKRVNTANKIIKDVTKTILDPTHRYDR